MNISSNLSIQRPAIAKASGGKPETGKEQPAHPEDRLDTAYPTEASEWYPKLQHLRNMVPKEQNRSMKVTPEKVRRNIEVTQLFHDLGMSLDKVINGRGPRAVPTGLCGRPTLPSEPEWCCEARPLC